MEFDEMDGSISHGTTRRPGDNTKNTQRIVSGRVKGTFGGGVVETRLA